ncbi:hypothetical protein DXG01_008820 [Tephrocybe rancida]|nr:hypothetical protein DXG01_008820 [Tephrocybe rancida]
MGFFIKASKSLAIEELLNPIDEIECLHKSTDEDICKAVLNAQQAAQDALINGGNDDVDDNADKPTDAFL